MTCLIGFHISQPAVSQDLQLGRDERHQLDRDPVDRPPCWPQDDQAPVRAEEEPSEERCCPLVRQFDLGTENSPLMACYVQPSEPLRQSRTCPRRLIS